jgi:hypothetical protein
MGYTRCETGFKSMWRGASTDGSWKDEGAACRRIALEVKFQEDVGVPLSQAMDYLGTHDAIVVVRLVDAKTRKTLDGLPAEHAKALELASARLPYRSIEIMLPTPP